MVGSTCSFSFNGPDNASELSGIFKKSSQTNLDDFVAFCVYFDDALEQNANSTLLLTQRQLELNQVLQEYAGSYSWTCGPPNCEILGCSPTAMQSTVPHLFCQKRVAEHLEEEWLVVYLLWKISTLFKSAYIVVYDNDGQFLLIEAAYGIPSWMTPENAENRIFLRQGTFCVLRHSPNQRVSLMSSLEMLRQPQACQKAALPLLQACLLSRIKPFESVLNAWHSKQGDPPQELSRHLRLSSCLPHHCVIIVPKTVAILLTLFPQLLSLAIDFFPPPQHSHKKTSNPTIDQSKHLFNFTSNHEEPSALLVHLTRYQYAKLQNSHCTKPIAFSLSSWKLPKDVEKHQAISSLDLGSKICLGLYTLCQTSLRCTLSSTIFLMPRPEQESLHSLQESPHDASSLLDPVVLQCDHDSIKPCALTREKTKDLPPDFYQHVVTSLLHSLDTRPTDSQQTTTRGSTLWSVLSSPRCAVPQLLCALYDHLTSSAIHSRFVFSPYHELHPMQSNTDWIYLDPHHLDLLFTPQSKEERFFNFLKKAQSPSNASIKPSGPNEDNLLCNVERVFNRPSDYRGIECHGDIQANVKTLPLEDIPEEFSKLYEEWVRTKEILQSDSESCTDDDLSSSSVDLHESDCHEWDSCASGPREPHESPHSFFSTVTKAMDQELHTMLTKENAQHQSHYSPSQFKTPDDLETCLKNNLKMSRDHEPFLNPGPASMFLLNEDKLDSYFK